MCGRGVSSGRAWIRGVPQWVTVHHLHTPQSARRAARTTAPPPHTHQPQQSAGLKRLQEELQIPNHRVPLSTRGVAEARAAGAVLQRHLLPDSGQQPASRLFMYTSPFLRCIQTAQHVAHALTDEQVRVWLHVEGDWRRATPRLHIQCLPTVLPAVCAPACGASFPVLSACISCWGTRRSRSCASRTGATSKVRGRRPKIMMTACAMGDFSTDSPRESLRRTSTTG